MIGHNYRTDLPTRAFGRMAAIAIGVVSLIVGLSMVGNVLENVDAHEIIVIQAARSGVLTWYTTPGIKMQWFGTVTSYPRQFNHHIEAKVQFNDGGTGMLKGSIQVEMPLDNEHLTALHLRYGSAEAIRATLIETVTHKAVTMTAPMMSSRESYAEKRNYLINWTEDQIANGIYRTDQRQSKVTEAGTEKTVIQVEIIRDAAGQPIRQETSAIATAGLHPFNFSMASLEYDDAVKKQIKDQQEIAMDVQKSIAEARKAEQRAITVEQQGRADAAEAKWKQEVVKATEVTQAEQKLAVSKLGNLEADQYKEATLKRADADATYRRRIMEADGALEKKLATYQAVQDRWAKAFENFKGPIVPSVVMGQGSGGQNAAMTMMDVLGIKAARDLSLEMAPKGGGGGK